MLILRAIEREADITHDAKENRPELSKLSPPGVLGSRISHRRPYLILSHPLSRKFFLKKVAGVLDRSKDMAQRAQLLSKLAVLESGSMAYSYRDPSRVREWADTLLLLQVFFPNETDLINKSVNRPDILERHES